MRGIRVWFFSDGTLHHYFKRENDNGGYIFHSMFDLMSIFSSYFTHCCNQKKKKKKITLSQ